jgi:anti-sigma factor RsiW
MRPRSGIRSKSSQPKSSISCSGEGARAQFMFERTDGERVTLYIGSLDAPSAPAPADETAFRYSVDGPVPSFYWIDRGFGYALAGKLPRDALLRLAGAVYRQL